MSFENRQPLACFWINYGLRNILCPCEISGHLLRKTFQEKNTQTSAISSGNNRKINEPSPPDLADGKLRTNYSNPSWHSNTGQQKSTEEAQPTPTKSERWQAITRDRLPSPWKILLERTKPAYAAWTYSELSLDLGPKPDDEIARQARRMRRAFLQNIIRELGQPAGTHTFWPCTIHDNNHFLANPDAFWSGMQYLGCRLLFVFGQDAWEACGLPEEFDGPPVYRACYPTRLASLDKLIAMPRGKLIASGLIQGAFRLAPPRPAR